MEQHCSVRILWADSWWDGPLTGVAAGDDRAFWFEAVFDDGRDDWSWPRRLTLCELSAGEFQRESERHARFEELVGNTRHCFHLPEQECHGPTEPPQRWAAFYDSDLGHRADYVQGETGWLDRLRESRNHAADSRSDV